MNVVLPSPPLNHDPKHCMDLLNTSKDGESSTCLGSLFQCFTTLSVKVFPVFLPFNLNLLWYKLRQFPLVLANQ